MRKNLFRDWSKSDFGYALKIIANVVLTTASVVFTLNVSSSYLWQSIILGIVFLIGSFYTEYCSLSFRSDTYIGNALYFAVFCLVVLTFSSSDLWITYAVIVAVSVLFSLFRFPLGEIMWGKNGGLMEKRRTIRLLRPDYTALHRHCLAGSSIGRFLQFDRYDNIGSDVYQAALCNC